MRKSLKKIGIGILTTAFVVTSIPSGAINVKAETASAKEDSQDIQDSEAGDNGNGAESGEIENGGEEAGGGEAGDGGEEAGGGEAGDSGEEAGGSEAGNDGEEAGGGEAGNGGGEAGGGEAGNGGEEAGGGEAGNGGEEAGGGEAGNGGEEAGGSEAGNDGEEAGGGEATAGTVPKGVNGIASQIVSGALSQITGEEKDSSLIFTSEDFTVRSDGSVAISLKDREVPMGSYGIVISATGNSRGYQVLADGKAAAFVMREVPEDEEAGAEEDSEKEQVLETAEKTEKEPSEEAGTEEAEKEAGEDGTEAAEKAAGETSIEKAEKAAGEKGTEETGEGRTEAAGKEAGEVGIEADKKTAGEGSGNAGTEEAGKTGREAAEESAEEDTIECASEYAILLEGEEDLVIKPSDGYRDGGEELEGGIISVELVEMDDEPLEFDFEGTISLYGADWFPKGMEEEPDLKRKQWIDFMLLERDGFVEDDYIIAAQLTGEREEYQIKVNGEAAGTLALSDDPDEAAEGTAYCLEPISLEPGDIVTVSAAKGESGFVEELVFASADMQPMLLAAEGQYTYYVDDFKGIGDTDNIWEAPRIYNMQPDSSFTISAKDKDLPEGYYRLSVSASGDRTAYVASVGTFKTMVKRDPSGWDDYTDGESSVIYLKTDDTITIATPPQNKDGSENLRGIWGRVASVTLEYIEDYEEQPQDTIVLDSSEWYFGGIRDNTGTADLRPDDQIDYYLRAEEGFEESANNYNMSIEIEGGRTDYIIKINNSGTGVFNCEEVEWGQIRTFEFTQPLTLKAGDVLTIRADSGWGAVGKITLTKIPPMPFEETDEITSITVSAEEGIVPEGSKLVVEIPSDDTLNSICGQQGLKKEKGVFYDIYLSDSQNNRIQPNGPVTIEIPVPSGYPKDSISVLHFKENKCEEIENYDIGGGKAVFDITSFSIFAVYNNSLIYEAENYYSGTVQKDGNVTFCDMQPGERITIPVDDQGLEAGNYKLSVSSNGNRSGYAFYINGVPAGTVKREPKENAWNAADLTDDEYSRTLYLKPGDTITIEAPADKWEDDQQKFGKLNSISLIPTDEEPEDPGMLDEVTLYSEDWYFGKPDSDRSANLRPNDQINYFIRTDDGFGDEARTYQMTVQAGGFRTAYTVKVNGEVIGSFSRPDTGWGEMNSTVFGQPLLLKAGDILSICAADSYGTVGAVTFRTTDEIAYAYEAEDFYHGTIQSDGGVTFCDVQPGETVTFTLSSQLKEGYYSLAASSNGTRTAYMVTVNGQPQGMIKRTASGWNAADLTTDTYDGVLLLKPGDTITLTASSNKDEGDSVTYGKLDSILLTVSSAPEEPQALDEITLNASDWYGGSQDSSGGMNVRPEDGVDMVLREQDGFTEGNYMLSLRVSGFRSSYIVKVNGSSVMELPVRTSNWGKYITASALETIHLKPGDVLTLYGAESWGCIDTVTFIKGGVPTGTSMEDRTGGRIKAVDYDISAGAKASGEEPVFIYQGEGYYKKQGDNPAADLQPGEQIEIPLSDNPNFVDGLYEVTVVSCGGRNHLFVKLNGQKTGRIDRTPNGYGMQYMSRSRLSRTVTLHRGDVLCIEAAPTEWGWVDYIRLDLVQRAEGLNPGQQETGVQDAERRYDYRAMDYYSIKQANNDVADLQPGDKIEIPVNDIGFEAGYYLVSATSCGGREKMSVEINGQEIGWINRHSNSYGMNSMVRDTMAESVYIKPGDTVAICAPANGGWAWVDKVSLIKVKE